MTLFVEQSKCLRSAHGFFGRRGGASAEPFDALNVSYSVGDVSEVVRRNRSLVAQALKADSVVTAKQVHGIHVALGAAAYEQTDHEADGLVEIEMNRAVGVLTADCVPVLIENDEGIVAALHAGWRGLVHGILEAGVASMGSHGALRAAIGPCIRACCFEVGEDVAAQLEARCGQDVRVQTGIGKPHIDLVRGCTSVLQAAGVSSIEVVGGCTRCDAVRYYSFRRDGPRAGRQMSAIKRSFS